MLDSGASKTFVNSWQGLQLTRHSDKVIITAGGTKLHATNTTFLPIHALSKGAREAIVVPEMSQTALMSVSTLANNEYTTVFLRGQQGVDVVYAKDVIISSMAPPALQGWWDSRGLWMVLIMDATPTSPGIEVAETTMGVYGLPSTKKLWDFYITYCGTAWQPHHISRHDTHKYLMTLPWLGQRSTWSTQGKLFGQQR